MTQEEKQLLLKDLSARQLFGIKICYTEFEYGCKSVWDVDYIYPDGNIVCKHPYAIHNIKNCQLYLRPMSSITEEEKQMMDNLWKDNNNLVFADPAEVRRYRFYDTSVVDFLNSRHFDYRGLIEKGLALEAPEDMYNLNEK